MADFDQVLKYWDAVEADYTKIGGTIMTSLFQQYPETQKRFSKFADLSPSEVASSTAVAAHGVVVLKKLGEILKTKGDHASIVEPLAKTHANIHKIPISNFKMFKEVAVKVFTEEVGLDADAQVALSNLMDVVIADINNCYKEQGFQE